MGAVHADVLADFNFIIQYRPGKLGGKPDILSRRLDYVLQEGDTHREQQKTTLITAPAGSPREREDTTEWVDKEVEYLPVLDEINCSGFTAIKRGEAIRFLQNVYAEQWLRARAKETGEPQLAPIPESEVEEIEWAAANNRNSDLYKYIRVQFRKLAVRLPADPNLPFFALPQWQSFRSESSTCQRPIRLYKK